MKARIKAIAAEMVKENGLINLTRANLSEAAGIADGSFPYVIGCTFNELLDEMMEEKDMEDYAGIVSKSRVNPTLRKQNILTAAVQLTRTGDPSRCEIAEAAGVSQALVSHYLGNMVEVREAVMREAVRLGVLEVIAKGMSISDPIAMGASDEQKSEAVNLMMGG